MCVCGRACGFQAPCNASQAAQRWSFLAPGEHPSEKKALFSRRTLSALINEAASNITNATALTLLPETDSKYGVNHIGATSLVYQDAEVACTTRGCTQYFPSQMWYLDGVSGQLMSGNYTASINEQWLTSMVPAPSRRCLSAIHSADMAGTPADNTEVWGGPLANGSLVVALQNRKAPNGTVVTAPISSLLGTNEFFSFAMLAPAAARANGYARSVATPPTAASSYKVRDVLAGKDLGAVSSTGEISAAVDLGDTRVFVLTPV